MHFCKDCIHSQAQEKFLHSEILLCMRTANTLIDPVSGKSKTSASYCSTERLFPRQGTKCGPDGTFFEKKEDRNQIPCKESKFKRIIAILKE